MKALKRKLIRLLLRYRGIKLPKDVFVNRKSQFTQFTSFGHNCHFNGMVITGKGKVVFGDNFHSGSGCKIITQFHNYQGEALPYDKTYQIKGVTIGDNVWLGDDVLILGGVDIGEGAIVQAGSVVAKNVPPLAIVGGHPAVPFKYRDQAHYNRLKKAGKFN